MAQLSSADQAAIQRLFESYGDAWMKRDAKRCASLFAVDAELLPIDGDACSSPAEIEAYYARQLSGPYRDFTVTDFAVVPPRALHRDVALMNASWKLHGFMNPSGAATPVDVRATLIVRRDGDEWRYVVARFMVPFTAQMPAA